MILLASLGDQPNPNKILRGHEEAHAQNREPDADMLMERVSDAWSWLVANAPCGPAPPQHSKRLVPRDGARARGHGGRNSAASARRATSS